MSDFNICEFKVLSNDKLLYHNLFYNIFLNNINTNNISENQRHLTVDKTQYYLLVLLTASFFFPKFIICHLTDIFCHHSIEILDFEINKFMFHCLLCAFHIFIRFPFSNARSQIYSLPTHSSIMLAW